MKNETYTETVRYTSLNANLVTNGAVIIPDLIIQLLKLVLCSGSEFEIHSHEIRNHYFVKYMQSIV